MMLWLCLFWAFLLGVLVGMFILLKVCIKILTGGGRKMLTLDERGEFSGDIEREET